MADAPMSDPEYAALVQDLGEIMEEGAQQAEVEAALGPVVGLGVEQAEVEVALMPGEERPAKRVKVEYCYQVLTKEQQMERFNERTQCLAMQNNDVRMVHPPMSYSGLSWIFGGSGEYRQLSAE